MLPAEECVRDPFFQYLSLSLSFSILSLSISISLFLSHQDSLAHVLLEVRNWQQLSDLFVFRTYIVLGFEEDGSPENLCILSCFV